MQKRHLRPRMLASTAARWQRPLLFVNQVGGQDDLVFDGASLAFDAGRAGDRARRRARQSIWWSSTSPPARGAIAPFDASDERSALAALALGTRDYARRCGFRTGAARAVGRDRLGAGRVHRRAGARSRRTCWASRCRRATRRPGRSTDAEALARALGIDFCTIPIEPMFAAYLETLASPLETFAPAGAPAAAAAAADLTAQNLQARVRGAILMALSNRQDRLLLTTGNKSEVATGYCTLYGDMAGGLAVISDAPKTLVYKLARAVNAAAVADGRPAPIPESTLTKPPSAELRPDQTDQDSLPPYDLLDAILEAHLVEGLDRPALVDRGFAAAVVDDVLRRVRTSEYKRRQMPPGLKITGKAFGPGPALPDRSSSGLSVSEAREIRVYP